jgi:hypothetical protein
MKIKILFIFLLLLIPFSLIFSFEFPNGFVLGESIFIPLGIPIYSGVNEGWYFPGLLAAMILSIGWIGSKNLLKDRYPKFVDNIFWFVLGFMISLKYIGE